MRTAYSLSGLRNSHRVAHVIAEGSVAVISFTTVATAVYGVSRYGKIKKALAMKVPKRTYGRATIGPYLAIMSFAALAISVIIVL